MQRHALSIKANKLDSTGGSNLRFIINPALSDKANKLDTGGSNLRFIINPALSDKANKLDTGGSHLRFIIILGRLGVSKKYYA